MLSRLLDNSKFSTAESTIGKQRSAFDLSHEHYLTMNAGKLYPCFISEILPGDTFDMKTNFVTHMSTPRVPVMDTALQSVWFFYVPMRLVWDHTREFFGENRTSSWTQQTEYFIPHLAAPDTSGDIDGFEADTVADHFGIPTYASGFRSVNALPLRAYRLIWNEWFRDQSTQDPKLINFGDVETDLTLMDLLPLNKRKDYFTSALPSPQKGPDVYLPLGSFAPVITREETALWFDPASGIDDFVNLKLNVKNGSSNTFNLLGTNLSDSRNGFSEEVLPISDDNHTLGYSSGKMAPSNLWADLQQVSGATINALRQAFAVQSLYELDARGGTRYREMLKVHFGVNVPDLTVSVPEFLGGTEQVIGMNQVVQTSGSNIGGQSTPQGNLAAFSKTVGMNVAGFVKSFTEPGYLIAVTGIRTLHTYQDGLNVLWSRRSRFDMYHPVLAHIGEQPIYNRELYAYGEVEEGDEVFGYKEAFSELRYIPSYVSGAFRSNYPHGSLDFWTYTDNFVEQPILSDGFIRETDQNVARSLATTNMEGAPQFICDMHFIINAYRPLPAYGTPASIGGWQ